MRRLFLSLLLVAGLGLISGIAFAEPILELRGPDLALLLPAAPGSEYPDLSGTKAFTKELFFMSHEGYLRVWVWNKLHRDISLDEARSILGKSGARPAHHRKAKKDVEATKEPMENKDGKVK